mgnify:CR=1 FL=1
MAKIKVLKDEDLKRGVDNTDVYPVSSTQALYSHYIDNGEMKVRQREYTPGVPEPEKLEDRLKDHEDDALDLHAKSEKFVVTLTNTLNPHETLFEIDGTEHIVTLQSSTYVETFGDQDSYAVVPTTDSISVTAGSITRTNNTYSWNLDDTVGSKTATYTATYGKQKSASVAVNTNLRKYFGFASTAPQNVTTLDGSQFSNSINCTVTIPANYNSSIDSSKFKKIYIAVPSGMSISRVVQPDALNAPLEIANLNNPTPLTREVGGTSYNYKLYWSSDLVDSSESKRLTIS